MGQSLRALVGARVSVVQGPEKVSHIAQQESGTKWAQERGHTIVGTFRDLDVSATVSPFERPDLGPWLAPEQQGEWDVLVFSKIDRMFRSTRDCVKFAEWADERNKILVFAEDGLTLNYRDKNQTGLESMMAELFIYIGSFFAQLELNRFKSRAKDAHRVLRGMDRWASGVPPLGFQVVDHPSGKGKGLDTDPIGKALLYEMAGKLLDGWSFIAITQWLNDTGALTNMDRARIAKGNEPKARPWTVNTVITSLTSLRTQGLKMTGNGKNSKTVLDAKGEPIRMAPPTFDTETWKKLQEAAAVRQNNRRTRTFSANPMLGVGFCAICGASLAQQFSRMKLASGETRQYRGYRCSRTPINCKGVSMRADDADKLLEDTFINAYGNEKVKRRVFVPGEDHSEELEQVRATIDRLRRESDAGLIVSADDERVYLERMKSLVDRRTELETMPYRPAGWAEIEAPETYAEAWETEDHHQLLKDRQVQFKLRSSKPITEYELIVP